MISFDELETDAKMDAAEVKRRLASGNYVIYLFQLTCLFQLFTFVIINDVKMYKCLILDERQKICMHAHI